LQRDFFKPNYHNGSTFTLQKTELSLSKLNDNSIVLTAGTPNLVLVCDEYLLTFANQIKRLQRDFFKPNYHKGSIFTLQKTELSLSKLNDNSIVLTAGTPVSLP
jgi:hypothetical protein